MAIVTLTTDFGTVDGYVGAMKGVILDRAPAANVVDVTHDIERHDITAASYALKVAANTFPYGTIHVAVVDPGVGGPRLPVVVVSEGQIFVGPDNGIFSLVAPEPEAAYEIAAERFKRTPVSDTFHGRDVFAAAAGVLAAGLEPSDAGPSVALQGVEPDPDADYIIMHVDHFGNLITDIPGEDLVEGSAVAFAEGPPIAAARTYADVPIGGALAYVGSANTVEIAVREGSAAQRLGGFRGQAVRIVDSAHGDG